jgi:hypothetical protein
MAGALSGVRRIKHACLTDPNGTRHAPTENGREKKGAWRRPGRGATQELLESAGKSITRACASGVLVAIGHTEESAEQIHQAVEAGARLSTHLGDGCPKMMHLHQSLLWAEL